MGWYLIRIGAGKAFWVFSRFYPTLLEPGHPMRGVKCRQLLLASREIHALEDHGSLRLYFHRLGVS